MSFAAAARARSLRAACCVLVPLLQACQMPGQLPGLPAAASVPAKLLNPGPACLADLQAFAERATGMSVVLTGASFAQSDELRLERPVIRGADGRPLDGRSLGRPEVFKLVRRGQSCVAMHANSSLEDPLPACNCVALTP